MTSKLSAGGRRAGRRAPCTRRGRAVAGPAGPGSPGSPVDLHRLEDATAPAVRVGGDALVVGGAVTTVTAPQRGDRVRGVAVRGRLSRLDPRRRRRSTLRALRLRRLGCALGGERPDPTAPELGVLGARAGPVPGVLERALRDAGLLASLEHLASGCASAAVRQVGADELGDLITFGLPISVAAVAEQIAHRAVRLLTREAEPGHAGGALWCVDRHRLDLVLERREILPAEVVLDLGEHERRLLGFLITGEPSAARPSWPNAADPETSSSGSLPVALMKCARPSIRQRVRSAMATSGSSAWR